MGSIPGLTLWDKDPALLKAAAQVSDACSLDLVLLWLWCRLAAAALIQPLAWEFPYAAGVIVKRKKKLEITYQKSLNM